MEPEYPSIQPNHEFQGLWAASHTSLLSYGVLFLLVLLVSSSIRLIFVEFLIRCPALLHILTEKLQCRGEVGLI